MKKVLIGEGDETLRRIMEITLMNEDFSVLFAANGQQVIDLAQSEVPDLIVSETRHPMLKGSELMDKLKALDGTAHIPVLLVMTAEEEGDRQEIDPASPGKRLLKPFSPMKFLATVSLALNKLNNSGSSGDMPGDDNAGEEPVESIEADEGGQGDNDRDRIFPEDSEARTLDFDDPLPGRDDG